MANAKKLSSVFFFIGILFFAFGIFLPNTFIIETPPKAEACIAIFPTPPECLPGEIQGWFAVGVIFFLIGGLYFVKANNVKLKDFKIGK